MSNYPKHPYLSPERPSQILSKSAVLKSLYARTKELLLIQDFIRSHISGDIYVAAHKEQTLHLIARSSTVATQLKYRQRNIISLLRQRYPIEKLKISVQPKDPDPPQFLHPAIPPSSENARQLADTAKYIEDEGLRKALIKLSERANAATTAP